LAEVVLLKQINAVLVGLTRVERQVSKELNEIKHIWEFSFNL